MCGGLHLLGSWQHAKYSKGLVFLFSANNLQRHRPWMYTVGKHKDLRCRSGFPRLIVTLWQPPLAVLCEYEQALKAAVIPSPKAIGLHDGLSLDTALNLSSIVPKAGLAKKGLKHAAVVWRHLLPDET